MFNWHNLDLQAALCTNDGEPHGISDWPLCEEPVDVIHTGHLMPVNCYDEIAFFNTADRGRALRRYGHDLDAIFCGQLIKAHQTPCERALLGGYPQVAASHSSQRQ